MPQPVQWEALTGVERGANVAMNKENIPTLIATLVFTNELKLSRLLKDVYLGAKLNL